VHVAGLQNGAAGEAIVWLKKLYRSVHACLCMLSMRVIGSHTMYIYSSKLHNRVVSKAIPQKLHFCGTRLRNSTRFFFDYVIRYTLISTFRFSSGFGEPQTPNQTYPNPNQQFRERERERAEPNPNSGSGFSQI
jgi:hypothetical protein